MVEKQSDTDYVTQLGNYYLYPSLVSLFTRFLFSFFLSLKPNIVSMLYNSSYCAEI
jgi:hypothetical protein